mmetsp:Transcript_27839/g.55766  ORF Transcript_27839/g.55766 Transcript_27839/m.55766 type:complete len:395 (+) Transcript_27839:95-1279(+)|eukprot:CAMPEP_0194323148 /NCGR_PEP_ID=MMETSP0171-20130528/24204_1 /TAXON_ID=218684 /ORGANISM="Corethron pennatum, Strain L29A3" /LENGTH=394 /DNA_ID=CAMNT_0039081673 /DNA_START=62 /DNA_END=1246 /DNA_ORIENTATION=+
MLFSAIALSLLILSSSAIADKENHLNSIRGAGEKEEYLHNDSLVTVDSRPIETKRSLSSNGNQDINIHNGLWGEWKPWKKIGKNGLYACGAELRFEGRQGSGDDTAANGLRLMYCGLESWYLQEQQEVWGGFWGDWRGMVMCPFGKYIGRARVKFEGRRGNGDDTALNGLAIDCVDRNWQGSATDTVYAGLWGSWKDWEGVSKKLVKGASLRFEGNQGSGDDTALNGIYFNVEVPNSGVSDAAIIGEWIRVASGPDGFIHKISQSSTTSRGKEVTKEEAYGFTQSISAGFEFKVLSVSAQLTAAQSFTTAQTVTQNLSVFKGTETTFTCPIVGTTGLVFMWQFKMSQPEDSSGIGFTSSSNDIRCTPSNLAPKCTLGTCADITCQKCIGEAFPL